MLSPRYGITWSRILRGLFQGVSKVPKGSRASQAVPVTTECLRHWEEQRSRLGHTSAGRSAGRSCSEALGNRTGALTFAMLKRNLGASRCYTFRHGSTFQHSPESLKIKLDMASVCSETAPKHPKTLPQSIQVDMMDTTQVTKNAAWRQQARLSATPLEPRQLPWVK